MRQTAILFALGLGVMPAMPAMAQDDAASDLVLILDASNSMWGQIDGVNKIVIARDAVGGLIDELPDATDVGLVAYGHRREGDCEDIEVMAPVGPLDKERLKSTINGINPKGRTPITASIDAAVELTEASDNAAVVLISDGLETCGLDPCGAVRAAKASGRPFVLHVIGFDVAGEDTAQLECAAQEGGGLYLSAENAEELSAALKSAYERPVEPDGRLVVKATEGDALIDALVSIRDAESGKHVGGGRTYTGAETNPRRVPLEDGRYSASVSAVGIKGSPEFDFDFEIVDGNAVEREFDFSSGEIAVHVTRNGELSDAVVRVYKKGERTTTASGRTYASPTSNPRVIDIAAGTYEVRLSSVEVKNGPEPVFPDIVVNGGERREITYEYSSGVLAVGVRRGEVLVDAVVNVIDAAGKNVAGGRTYTRPTSNPKSFVLIPGDYTVRIREIRGEQTEATARIAAGETAALTVDLETQ